jgi:hypothetical protein
MLMRLISFLLLVSLATAQSTREQLTELRKAARAQYQAKDYAAMHATMLQLDTLLHHSPRAIYNLAVSAAGAGNKAEALQWLEQYASEGLYADVAKDEDLASLREEIAFKALIKRLDANRNPVSRSTTFATAPADDLLPEDITYSASQRSFFLACAIGKKVLKLDPGKHFSVFFENQHPWPMYAVRADNAHSILWATTAASPDTATSPKEDWGKSELLKLDLKSGKLLATFKLDDGQPHIFGDMTVTPAGDVIVADSLGPGIYRLKSGERKLEQLATGFFSPQTPALHSDGIHLFIPDYTAGIAVLDLRSGKLSWIDPDGKATLAYIDGLYFYKGDLIAVQNGTAPERLIRIHVSRDLTKATGYEVIEQSTQDLGDPTHAAIQGDDIYFIANSGWDQLDDAMQLKLGAKMSPATIKKTPLAPMTKTER